MPSIFLCYICRVKAQTLHQYILVQFGIYKTVFAIQYFTFSLAENHLIFLRCNGLTPDPGG